MKTRPDEPVVESTGVTISPKTNNLEVSQTRQLSAAVEPTGASQDVIWESSDTEVATVDESGLMTAVGIGQATITVTANNVSDAATVNVTETEEG